MDQQLNLLFYRLLDTTSKLQASVSEAAGTGRGEGYGSMHSARSWLGRPYVRRLDIVGRMHFYEVNGQYVRDEVDPDFTNFAQHFAKKYVPEWEGWIDRGAPRDEQLRFEKHMLIEHRLMAGGMVYEKALEIADRYERADRRRAIPEPPDATGREKAYAVELYRLEQVGPIHIMIVDEAKVRAWFFNDFTEGGHDLVYPFIPPNSVWVGNEQAKGEWVYTIAHELYERHLMSQGMKYHQAHQAALRVEWAMRHAA